MPESSRQDIHAVILAGGSGTRFWPLSRELSPKQMLSVFGETSLICDTILRARSIVGADAPLEIVVGTVLFDEIRNHLLAQPQLSDAQLEYVIEPVARNTAPALALAAATIEARDPEALVVMLPSDQLVESDEMWVKTMKAALAEAKHDRLVTIGLVPTRPETGYGYIKAASELSHKAPQKGTTSSKLRVASVEAFVEKPDVPTAQRYLEAGNYYWNSGMLVAKARVILEELCRVQGLNAASADNVQIVETARALAAVPEAEHFKAAALRAFEALPSVSFDTAVLELSNRVSVVPTTMNWSDVGSLLALETLVQPDKQGNHIIGEGLAVDSRNTLIYSKDRLLATLGTQDLFVVDTPDATLVAPRERAQDVRLVVQALQNREAPEVREPRVSQRPWGTWNIVEQGNGFKVKELTILPGARLSLQSHERRSEHWVVVAGTATVTQEGTVRDISCGESVFIPARTQHRLENRGTGDLHIIEIQVGDYLGEDDITRYSDDFNRRSY